MRVKPSRPGLLVGIPGRPRVYLRPEGEEVPRSSYWLRRLRGGDVVLCEDPPRARTSVDETDAAARATPTSTRRKRGRRPTPPGDTED